MVGRPGSADCALARNAGARRPRRRLLVIALLPDLDSRFERLYGYLNDDVTRRRASIGLALELAGASPMSAAARRALSPSGPLVDLGLVLVEDPDRPFLTRACGCPTGWPRTCSATTHPSRRSAGAARDVDGYPSPLADRLARRAARRGRRSSTSASARPGPARRRPSRPWQPAGRDARRRRPAPAGPRIPTRRGLVRRLRPRGAAPRRRAGGRTGRGPGRAPRRSRCSGCRRWPSPVLFVGRRDLGSAVVDRRRRWSWRLRSSVPASGSRCCATTCERVGADVDPDALGAHLSLGPAQVQRAVRAAQTVGPARRRPRSPPTTCAAASGPRTPPGLERLARRIEPEVGWDDLVLAPGVRAGAARSWPPGPGTATRCSSTGGCARAAGAAAA